MRDWHASQHALLKRVNGMFASMCYSPCFMHYSRGTGMLAIRCCLSGSCVLAIMHFWHA